MEEIKTNLEIVNCSYLPFDERPIITESKALERFLRMIWNKDINHIERAYLICLNRANAVVGYQLVSMGGMAGTVIDPKVVFQYALAFSSSAICIAHNHPSGSLKPSKADVKITENIKAAGKFLDVPLLDHIILTSESYYSFADSGDL